MTKVCFKCGKEKDISCFYKHNAMSDGYLGKCKECTKKDVHENRVINLERIREYDRNRKNSKERNLSNKQRIIDMKLNDPEKYKLMMKKKRDKYKKTNIEKLRARYKVYYAVSTGKLHNPCKCECCGIKCFPEAHHYDYSKPLDVIWLCDFCHKEVHKKMRREIKANKQ